MIVVTADQRRSRSGPDLVDDVLAVLAGPSLGHRWVRGCERTAGDEVQGITDDAGLVVEVALLLVREDQWSVGIGVGPVRQPLPASARAGAGPAYEHARAAVERAKSSPDRVCVSGPDGPAARSAQAVLGLLAAVVQRRTPAGWEAVDLITSGLTRAEAAHELGISRQAISQRLLVGTWPQEERARRVAADLLSAADGTMAA